MHFKDISDGPFLCPDVEKISKFHPDVKILHFSVRTLNFVLIRPVIGPIMHKNAIKHKNIGFKGCISAPKAPKKFSTPSTLDIMGVFSA